MPNYKEAYIRMLQASEKAMNLLIAAQQECEELCIMNPLPELKTISFSQEENSKKD